MAELGEREPVERAPRRRWAAWLLLPIVGMALAVPFMIDRSLERATGPGAAPVASVEYQGARWVPSGAPLAIADDRMVRIGAGRDGRPLYLVDTPRGGGGGPQADRRLPKSLMYLRLGEGAYQPLVPR